MTLTELLKDSAYKLTQFTTAQIQALESSITTKEKRNKQIPHVICLVRNKEIELTPEEVVRQLYLKKLNQEFGYPYNRMECEWTVQQGSDSTTKRADIVVFDKDRPTEPYILVELKKPKEKGGQDQLKSYCSWSGSSIGVWTNGTEIECFYKNFSQKSKSNFLDKLPHLPSAHQSLADVLNERFTIKDLIKNDALQSKSLRQVILEFENIVLANAGVDAFEEIFKLIFAKLFDEMQSGSDKDAINTLQRHGIALNDIDDKSFRALEFRNSGTDTDVKKRLEKLFEGARNKWDGIFPAHSSFNLTPSHLNSCVSYLQEIKLFNSNLDVVDDAFEYLISKSNKGEKGQYFTPRYVIDMCVKMLNPQAHETLIDTAAGSCGFPMHGIFHVWQALEPDATNLFTTDKRTPEQLAYVQNNVFGIDFDTRVVRIGRTLNLIAGDGQTNVLELNTLDYMNWREPTSQQSWIDIYNDGFKKLKKLRPKGCDEGDFKRFEFDVLMANPPFAGDISGNTLSHYQLGKNAAGKYQNKVGRDVLFIERNLNFLKAGGRMAVVLPQGRFNNSSDKNIRDYIAEHCRILAVVGLHGNVFKPHTGTKTSVLLVQKWTDDNGICPRQDDYPIFFATMQKPSKDNSGDKIYRKGENGYWVKDIHGHFIIDHDLFSTQLQNGSYTEDGIAEAFIEFAKKENLSFFDLDLSGFKNLKGLDDASLNADLRGFKNLAGLYAEPFNEVKYWALLERLEVSILMFSEVSKASYSSRIDSYFFQKEFLNTLSRYDFCYLSDICLIKSGTTPIDRDENLKSGVILLKTNNIRNGVLNFTSIEDFFFIDDKTNKKMKETEIIKNDILINIVGATTDVIGRCSLISMHFPKANITQAMALLRIKKDYKVKFNSFFIFIFLISKLGHKQVRQIARPTGQFNMNLQEVGSFKIPILNFNFQNKIKDIVLQSEKTKTQSQELYFQAETLLLNALGIADFSPSTENINIKSFKDSFVATGRLDAEYYQPKYDYIESIFNQFSRVRIADLVNYPVSSGITPKAGGDDYTDIENGVPFIRAVDLQNGQVRLDNFNYIKPEIHNGILKRTQLKKNDFLFSIAGTVGRCAMFEHDFEANINQAVAILRFNNEQVNHYYLMMLFNSKIGKEFVAKYARQGVQTNLNLAEVGNLSIPIIDRETQTKIADLIQQSFTLKAQSEQLLATAKRAVELAIETNEQTALAYITEATNIEIQT